MTLRLRLTLVIAAVVTASIALVALVVFHNERRELQLLVDDDLSLLASSVAGEMLTSGEIEGPLQSGTLMSTVSFAQVVAPGGRVTSLVADGPELPVDDQVRAVAAGQHDRFSSTAEVDGQSFRVLTVPLGGGALQIGRSLAQLEQHTLHVGWLLALVTVGGMTIAIVLGRVSAGAALRPVSRLTASAERISATLDLRKPLEVRTNDELGRLAASLNTMLVALDDSQRRQQRLVTDAAHELQTPLATMLTNVEVLERADRLPPHERAQVIADVRAEIHSLITTVQGLLDLARCKPTEQQREQLELADLVREVVADARRRWPRVRFGADLRPLTVSADPDQVQRALANLLDNAAKWSPQDATVEVCLGDHELIVRDHGPGIEPEDLELFFERYYRAPAARGLPGSGLGLAIVRQVADAHGWRVAAKNAVGGGSSFRVDLRPDSSPVLNRVSMSSHAAAPDFRHRPHPTDRDRRTVRDSIRVHPLRSLLVVAAAVPLVVAVSVRSITDDKPLELTTLNGTLVGCGDRLCLGSRVVDFGPGWYIREAHAHYDYDGDGEIGALQAELDGLLGGDVTLETDRGQTDADVFAVNGLPFRSTDGELPPPDPDRVGASSAAALPPEATREALTGVLAVCEDDDWCVGGVVLNFGPHWYLSSVRAAHDYDGDGERDTVAGELAGLKGDEVKVDIVRGGTRPAVVLTIDGLTYRDPRGPPPWFGGPLRMPDP